MAGSRPVTDKEVKMILEELGTKRNQCLFTLGLKTVFRISELLSIKVSDVVQYGKIKDSLTVSRANMKGKISSRSVVLHQTAKDALQSMNVLEMAPEARLFPIRREQASRLIKRAVTRARIEGKVTSHSARKVFAKKVHELFGRDLVKTQKALGHRSVASTAYYIQFDQQEIDDAILRT